MAEEDKEEANKALTVTFDDILKEIGEFGKHQKLLYLLFSLPYVFTSMQLVSWVFVSQQPAYKGDSCSNGTIGGKSSFGGEWNLACQEEEWWQAAIGAAPMAGYLVGK